MSDCAAHIRAMEDDDRLLVGALNAAAFGPGRFARSAYRVREAATGPALALVAEDGARLVGSIELTAVTIGGVRGALLLGPLAVAPEYRGHGCGFRLIAAALAESRMAGWRYVVLVGDEPYYARAGFAAVPPGRITLPGPVDAARVLACEIEPGCAAGYAGPIEAARWGREP